MAPTPPPPQPTAGLRRLFDEILGQVAASSTLRQIWADVYRDDYPLDTAPHYNFLTKSELQLLTSFLKLGAGQRFVDIGCGLGGPGRWIARQTGADRVGLDFSCVGVAAAATDIELTTLRSRSSFVIADAMRIPLRDESMHAAISIDTFQIIKDPIAAAAEVLRVLKPDSVFAFTSWATVNEIRGLAFVPDYQQLLSSVGFSVLAENTPNSWERRQRAIFEQMALRAEDIRTDVGEAVAEKLLREAAVVPDFLSSMRRLAIVAKKGRA